MADRPAGTRENDMQKLILSGMVVRDAELRTTQNGDKVLGFAVVCDNGKDRDGNRRDGTFYDCSIWGKRAESLSNHITKGKYLTLEGKPTAKEYQGKASIGLMVNDFSFAGEKGGGHSPRENDGYGAGGNANAGRDMGDSIPFAPEWRA